jgi:phosphatidylserine/phosphatidylglycerophosphate/cardiolipin synthase-like enzyme
MRADVRAPRAIAASLLLALACSVGAGERWWSVYFTAPGGASPFTQNPEDALVERIDAARKSFHGAFYSISSQRIAQTLVAAKKRGVDVRIVTEKDTVCDQVWLLVNAGIPVVTDERRALMHDKFAVIDDEITWTGSYNLTYNGAFENDNNAIAIRSADLAAIYQAEFREMHEGGIFGNRKEPGVFGFLTKKYHVKIEETNINAYFSPEDNIERIIVDRLGKVKKSVRFLAFSFTSDPIAEELIRLHRKGVSVEGVFEKEGSTTEHCEYAKLLVEGVAVKLDRNPHHMHHKVFILDEALLITGSFNFSRGANTKNDENVIMLDNREIIAEYLREFRRIYD